MLNLPSIHNKKPSFEYERLMFNFLVRNGFFTASQEAIEFVNAIAIVLIDKEKR